jgi:hypothetical protein
MAKAKKQESAGRETGATKKKAAGAKPEAKTTPKAPAKGGAHKHAPAGAPMVPLIDTSLAAAAAANMVLNRAVAGAGTGAATGPAPALSPGDATAEGAADKRETSTFKQLKQGLSKSGAQGIGGALGAVQPGKKSTQTFAGPNQVRRNQTFGSDASRTNVPRRTGG